MARQSDSVKCRDLVRRLAAAYAAAERECGHPVTVAESPVFLAAALDTQQGAYFLLADLRYVQTLGPPPALARELAELAMRVRPYQAEFEKALAESLRAL